MQGWNVFRYDSLNCLPVFSGVSEDYATFSHDLDNLTTDAFRGEDLRVMFMNYLDPDYHRDVKAIYDHYFNR